MIGKTILHYKIVEKLGEGGMGEVYKAQDTKLDRFVALKFLPSQMSASEDDKARFIQEAKAASAMNHPNVCTIYDIQENDGQLFIVMEYVEGKTLKDLVETHRNASLPTKQILEIGTQVADGLAAAHEKGIVHRDIKPENIMIRKDGIAQIMDFGLAKLRETSGVSRLTKAGTTMGTMGYMSPEQVQGLDVDHRSDIFSLGVVLYELLTGELPFKGVHETAIMYEIVNVDPLPISTVKEGIEPELDRIILECLEKDKDERCQSAKELAKDLKKVKRSSGHRKSRVYNTSELTQPISTSGSIINQNVSSKNLIYKISPVIAALFLVTTSIFGVLYFTKTSNLNAPEARSHIILPKGVKLTDSYHGSNIAISPNGKYITFIGTDSSGVTKLWLRPLNSLQAKPIADAFFLSFPFWSPDSRFIAYFFEGKLNKISIEGGQPITICNTSGGAGGTWNSSGTIIFIPNYLGGLYKVSADGGKPELLIPLSKNKDWGGFRWPYFLPDGKHFLFTIVANGFGTYEQNRGAYKIYAASIDDPKTRLILNASSEAEFSNGYLFFVKQKILFARRFNTGNLKFSGESIPIAANVQYYPGDAGGVFSVSNKRTIIYQQSISQDEKIMLLNKKGNTQNLLLTNNVRYRASFSSDGKMIAFDSYNNKNNSDIWIYNKSRNIASRFTFNSASDADPIWSPDDKKIIFSSYRSNNFSLYVKNSDGSGKVKPFFTNNSKNIIMATDWSKNGKYVGVMVQSYKDQSSMWDILLIPSSGKNKPVKFLVTDFNEGVPKFSPDSKWIAYWSNQSGKYQIYVSPFSGGSKWQVSNVENLNWGPRWIKDGKAIYFGTSDNKVWGVNVKENGSTLSFGNQYEVLDYNKSGENITIYDVNKTGDTFVAGISNRNGFPSSITMLTNWQEEMKGKK